MGYYSLTDLNDNAGSGSWSLHQHKNMFGEFFLTRPAIDVNDKEQLRQTILNHECVFKHQLHELHRVYKIQIDMMNEVRSKELRKHMIQAGAFQSSIYSSGFPLADDKASTHFSNLPSVDLNHGRLSMSGHCQNGKGLKDCETLEPGRKRLQTRLFDLELPADKYINDEEEEGLGVSSGVSRVDDFLRSTKREVIHATDGNLSTRTGVNSGCYSDSPSPNFYMKRKNGFECLAYKFSQDLQKGRDGGVSRNNMNLETERRQKGWLAYNADAGQTGSSLCASFSREDLRKPSKPQQIELRNSHELAISHHVKQKIFGVEICERTPGASVEASCTLLQHPFIPQSNTVNSQSSSISHKKLYSGLSRNISVQGNPSFGSFAQSNKSCVTMMHSPEVIKEKVVNSNSRNVPERRYQTEASVNGTRKQNPQGGLPWLKVVPSCNGNSSEEWKGSSQMNLNSLQNCSQQFVDITEMIRKSSFQSFVQDSSSATCALDAEQWRTEVGECSSNRSILGFSISERPLPNTYSKPSYHSAAVGADSVKVGSHDTKGQDPVENLTGKGLTNRLADSRNHIDLNLCFDEEGVEEKAQSSHSSSKTDRKIAFKIDLEVQVDVEEMDITPGAESLESEPEEHVHMLQQDESRKLHEELIKVAAEALVAISSSCVPLQADDDFDHQSKTWPSDPLLWFAELISSYKGDIGNESGSVSMNHHDSVHPEVIFSDHGMDHFEFMTLNLTETTIEENHHEPEVLESPKNENTLTRRPRRSQARRGRQRKDFQRDVLPTVVSLSKNEVMDDLQTIEGLIRATGGTWQSSLALKNGGRGRGGGGKGRRRSGGSDVAANVTATCPPQVQLPKCGEAEREQRNLIGWGKRTRRPPRQRCSINILALTIK